MNATKRRRRKEARAATRYAMHPPQGEHDDQHMTNPGAQRFLRNARRKFYSQRPSAELLQELRELAEARLRPAARVAGVELATAEDADDGGAHGTSSSPSSTPS